MKAKWWQGLVALLAVLMLSISPARAVSDADFALVMAGGQKYLLDQFVDDGGGKGHWGTSYSLAQTAAAVAALLDTGKYSDAAYKAVIDKGVQYILSKAQANGSIKDNNPAYDTGLSLVALTFYGHAATLDAAARVNFDAYIQNAVAYLRDNQGADGGWTYTPNPTDTGSDISNTQFGVMGMYYGSNYLGLPINADTAGSWAAKLYAYLKTMQVADGHIQYDNGYTITAETDTSAGLWSLAMIGKGASAEALAAINFLGSWYAPRAPSWQSSYTSGGDYYFVYAMAKALAGTVGGNANLNGKTWLPNLKDFINTKKATTATSGEYVWNDSAWLPSSNIATAFVLMSVSLSGSGQAVENVVPAAGDAPIPGLVNLKPADTGVTISSSNSGRIDQGTLDAGVNLPVGSFEFTLSNVTTATTKLRITPPGGALDVNNPAGFLNANGTIKAGLTWFKLVGGAWKGLPGVPISLGPVGGPYTYIEVTLTDNGPEDTDNTTGVIKDPGAPGVGFTGNSTPGDSHTTVTVADPAGTDVAAANQGPVTLQVTTAGAVIDSVPATRANIATATVDNGVLLPVGGFNFTISGLVPDGRTAVLRITPPHMADFLNANGTAKSTLAWYKSVGGKWVQSGAPITVGPAGAPTYLEVTLQDGGPGDSDGIINGVISDPGAPGVGAPAAGSSSSGGSSNCFIATAAFGSSMAPDVMVLRKFRDHYLLTNAFGRMFVNTYYAVSPPIAHFIAQNDTLRAATRVALTPIIFTVKHPMNALGMLILALAAGLFLTRRRNEDMV